MSKKLVCPACGAKNYSGDVYCRKCNGALYEKNPVNEKNVADKQTVFNLK